MPDENIENIINELSENIVKTVREGRKSYNINDFRTYRVCKQKLIEQTEKYRNITGEPYVFKKKDYQQV